MRIMSQPGGKAKALAFGILVVLVWGFFLVRAIQVFAPDSVYVQPYNSDSALPVLMANDETIDAFRTYIYGQDQVGAWPSLLSQFVRRATGHVWTPPQIHIMQATWLFLSVFLVAALTRSYSYSTGALLLLTLCLHPTVSHYFFVLNQRFAWQTTALFLCWWSLRRACEYGFGGEASGRGGVAFRHLLTFCFAFLAAWTSPSSVPVLCVFFVLEWVRARIVSARSGEPRPRLAPASFAAALPLAAGFAAQQLLKANYHRFALKHFGQDYRTPVEFDRGYLWINLRHQLDNLFDAPWYALTLLAVSAAPFVAFQLLRRLRQVAPDEPGRGEDAGARRARVDLGVLLLGSCAVAVINFVTSFVFSWMRLNAYGARYLALTYMFGTFAGLLALLWLISLPEKIHAVRRLVFPLLAAACLVLLALKFPPVSKEPTYQQMSEVAADLSRRAPPATPLLGGYWDTYALVSLQTDAPLIPVPAEDQLVRTPWTPRLMRQAAQVLVVHHVFASPGGAERVSAYTTFGDGQNPPAFIRQHGATLRLHTPRWYERHGYTFSLYQNQEAAK